MNDRSKGAAQRRGSRGTKDVALPGKLLYGPFTFDRHEMAITETGLYGRPSRGDYVAHGAFVMTYGLVFLALVVSSIVRGDWRTAGLSVCGALVIILGGMETFKGRKFKPLLEIRDSRVIVGTRDYGPLDGAYLQPEVKGKCVLFLHTAAAPHGVYVLQLVNRRDILTLYGLLIQHLHLDGSRSGDWPPRPERSGNDADRSA